jgi:hypothetical protein
MQPISEKVTSGQMYFTEIPEKIDLAVIAVKAELVFSVMEECINSWVKGAIIVSGGFAGTGLSNPRDSIIALARERSFHVSAQIASAYMQRPGWIPFLFPTSGW